MIINSFLGTVGILLCHRVNGVNLKMEAVSSTSLFEKWKKILDMSNKVSSIHRSNDNDYNNFCYDYLVAHSLSFFCSFSFFFIWLHLHPFNYFTFTT